MREGAVEGCSPQPWLPQLCALGSLQALAPLWGHSHPPGTQAPDLGGGLGSPPLMSHTPSGGGSRPSPVPTE